VVTPVVCIDDIIVERSVELIEGVVTSFVVGALVVIGIVVVDGM